VRWRKKGISDRGGRKKFLSEGGHLGIIVSSLRGKKKALSVPRPRKGTWAPTGEEKEC